MDDVEKTLLACWWGRPSIGDTDLPSTYLFDKIQQEISQEILWVNDALKAHKFDYENDISLNLVLDENKIRDIVYVRPYDNKIFVGELFLAYLWIMCFCAYSDFHEICFMRYTEDGANERKLLLNAEFRDYANRLFLRYEKWDLKLYPNPALYHKYSCFEINCASVLFRHALSFIIHHECAHIIHNHGAIDHINKNLVDSVKKEYEADKTALGLMLAGIDSKEITDSIKVGAVLGLLSILFVRTKLDDADHPADHKRVKKLLEEINTEDTNNSWGFAAVLLQRWTRISNSDSIPLSNGDMSFETFKDQFDYVYEYVSLKK